MGDGVCCSVDRAGGTCSCADEYQTDVGCAAQESFCISCCTGDDVADSFILEDLSESIKSKKGGRYGRSHKQECYLSGR